MDLISVIVPVYKVEPYLDKCVQSIVEQTYRNLEIILVDDGSPDNCGAMCDAWARRDGRIKVIHKENGGLSDARNAGLAAASGEYIGFVDSDDWISPEFYEALYTAIQKGSVIAASGIVWAYDDHLEADAHPYAGRDYTPLEALDSLTSGCGFYAVAWNKLYSVALFTDIRYPVGKIHEDEFVTYRLVGRAQVLTLCPEAKYYYRQRSGSIMNKWSSQHLDALEAYAQRLNYLYTYYPELYLKDKVSFLLACVWQYRCCKDITDRKNAQKQVLYYAKGIHFRFCELCILRPTDFFRIIRAKCTLYLADWTISIRK